MDSVQAPTRSGINGMDELDLYWEDLDRYWHLPRIKGVDKPKSVNPKERTLMRRRIRRAQRVAAAMVEARLVH